MAVELYLTIDLPVTELQRFLPANDAPSVGLPGVYSIILKGLEEDDPEFEFCSERFAIRPRAAVSFRVEKNEYHEDTGFLGYHSALIVVARLLTESTADLVLRDGSTRILLYRAGGMLVLNRDVEMWFSPAARLLNQSFTGLSITS